MNDLYADPAALRATGPRFTAVADDVATAAGRLRGVIEAEGECWGTDQLGQAFSKDYKPGEVEGQEAIQGLRDVFAGYAKDLPAVADSLQAQDDSTQFSPYSDQHGPLSLALTLGADFIETEPTNLDLDDVGCIQPGGHAATRAHHVNYVALGHWFTHQLAEIETYGEARYHRPPHVGGSISQKYR
ncbi:hypothetical protein [Nocardia carnea]|uniref:Uncharacterized protein n=1 Tax=Nocardia carnea TaxID=37328 RepID=A0ABW7TPY1_9NOCA|nr:hypothetical protein [Nocardia carnea]